MVNTSEMKTMNDRKREMMHIVISGKETRAERKARLAEMRKTMSPSEYKAALARDRCNAGFERPAVTFKDKTRDTRHLRREAKKACRVVGW